MAAAAQAEIPPALFVVVVAAAVPEMSWFAEEVGVGVGESQFQYR